MTWNRLKEMAALAVCTFALAGAAANAQVVIGSTSGSSTEYTVGTWSDMSTLGVDDGSFVVSHFGTRDGKLVAYGRLVPTSRSSMESFDASALGSWTGIGTGYGESGVESRSNLRSDNDGPVSMSLVRPDDGDVDLRMGPTSGNDRVASGIDVQFGPTSGNDRVGSGIDIRFGPTSGNDRVGGVDVSMGATSANDRSGIDLQAGSTSANDRTTIDAQMGATSGNDRSGIDLKFGPTSGNDRVAGGSIDLSVGPTSGNDRTALDGDMGATSANDRMTIDASMGATSGNDRTSIDASMGATSGNDRRDISISSSDYVVVPVTVVSSSCDAVALSFGGSDNVVIRASDASSRADVRSSLCAVSTASSSAAIESELNRLIGY
jgi:hypothetical protein